KDWNIVCVGIYSRASQPRGIKALRGSSSGQRSTQCRTQLDWTGRHVRRDQFTMASVLYQVQRRQRSGSIGLRSSEREQRTPMRLDRIARKLRKPVFVMNP